jgi:hypothetical protein
MRRLCCHSCQKKVSLAIASNHKHISILHPIDVERTINRSIGTNVQEIVYG